VATLVARALKKQLTEEGLTRIIEKNSRYTRVEINTHQPEELGRLINQLPRSTPMMGRRSRPKDKLPPKVRKAGAPKFNYSQSGYWHRVKQELHVLICSDDKRYANLRRLLAKPQTQTLLVSNISVAVAGWLGVGMAAITAARRDSPFGGCTSGSKCAEAQTRTRGSRR
jgi:hypothetical protein